MMSMLLLALGAAAVPPQVDSAAAIADPANRQAASLCESALAQKADGTIESISVDSAKRSGEHTILSGDIQVFRKAPAPPPGELSPHHVISINFAFQCTLCGQRVVRATVIPETN